MACERGGEGEALQLNSWITAFSKAKFGFVLTSGTVIKYVPVVQQRCRKEGEGGGGAPRVSPFWVTPYYEVKPYLHWFVVKILFPSFELKTNQFSGKDFFWFWNSHISGLKKPITLTAMTFFLSSLVFGPKRGDTTKFCPGATIPSNATVVQYLYTYRWYSIYMPSSGTVSISK